MQVKLNPKHKALENSRKRIQKHQSKIAMDKHYSRIDREIDEGPRHPDRN